MHIKKLEIAGFKSFVDRTVIHFDHDVIGVVGPNGCGKSNIVDAIRWCMGEQSAKHLRGRAMEDVIFNGAESRSPAGLSEVTLTFDNSSAEYAAALPPEYRDYPEIAVTRRLYRDGTSEYLINKTQVRLRDVTELFLGTGVGTKAYSIVEQGRIGQIVSARPQDRRLFIEEAAGITKYKQRRKQAERKMDLTRQNLLRITDIVNEIDRTRASLKRQAAKAERFVQYRGELEDLFLHDASHRLLELIVVEQVARGGLEESGGRTSKIRDDVAARELALSTARQESTEIEERAEVASKTAFEADNRVTTLQAEFERSRDRIHHLSERLKSANTEQDEIRLKLTALGHERQDAESRISELQKDEASRNADAAQEDASLLELQEAERSAQHTVEQLRQTTTTLSSELAATRARLEATEQQLEQGRARRDRAAAESEELAAELANLHAKLTALQRGVEESAEGKRLSSLELEQLAAELEALRPQVLESERAVDAHKNQLSLRRNRLRALEDLHRRFEGVGSGVRALLSKGDERVRGLIADRIDVEEKYTHALAGLLGDRLQCVVVEDPDYGLELLSTLRSDKAGRASIVSTTASFVAGSAARVAAGQPESLGRLADQLGYEAADEGLVRSLIGDAILVESAASGLALARRYPGITAVSLDGTVVRPDGVISGGSGDDVASAMVEHKREMRHLTDEVAQLERETAELVQSHTQLQARITELSTSLDRARQGAHESELAHVTAEKDLVRTEGEIATAELRRSKLTTELGQLDELVAKSEATARQNVSDLDALERQLETNNAELKAAEEQASQRKEQATAQAALVMERKVRLAQVREQLEAARATVERLAHQRSELEHRSERLAADAHEAAVAYGETAAELLMNREARAEAVAVASAAHDELNEVRGLLEQIRSALGLKEGELRELRVELTELEEVVREHQMKLQKLELERHHLIGNVRERFRGLDLLRVVGDYHARPAPDDEHRRRIDELTKLIDRMGPVNLDARSEYEEAETRFAALSTQKEDIEKALADLERAIRHMDRESRRRFRETFHSVNELFKKTFNRMFRGGRAELLLTDPDNLLESGVDIVAQPPGKKLANIELMSGGEKALTATSLIFAIFQHKPSPFCVLDEVDAPLDEANVARYNEAIRNMTDRSQFILITHIKQTMQSVDVLYGVTMGEPGVSRLVSVKVNDEAVTRSERGPSQLEQTSGSTQVA